MIRRFANAIVIMGWLVGCQTPTEVDAVTSSSTVQIGVQALNLPVATDVLYAFRLYNDDGQLMWSESQVSANAHGAGDGSLSYFGPCDPADNDTDGTFGESTLEVEITELVGLSSDEWVNPGVLTHTFTCSENTSALVDVDMVVAIDGELGFLDVAVNLEGLQCSAALDCVDDQGGPLLLVQDGGGVRQRSAILSLSCIAPGSDDIHLYMDDVEIVCDTGTAVIDPTILGLTQDTTSEPLVIASLVSQGQASFSSGDTSRHWFVALGLDTTDPGIAPTGPDVNCTLQASAAASDGPLTSNTTPSGTTYPYITWNVGLNTALDGLTCTNHPLDGGVGVDVVYTSTSSPVTFDHEFTF